MADIEHHPDFPTWDPEEQAAAIAQEAIDKAAARDAFKITAAYAAAQAVTANANLRAANATMRTALTAFIGGTPPAGTLADQVAWLYARTKELAGAVRNTLDEIDLVTREADGLIDLFRVVIPAVDELFDT